MEAKDKNEYILAWKSKLDVFNLLGFVANEKLSDKVFKLIDEFERVIEAVADSKFD